MFLGILLVKLVSFGVIFVINRTDLAVECYEENEKTALSGVKITEDENITTVEVLNENGSKAIGKPVGKYVVLDVNSFVNDTDILDGRLEEFSTVLKSVMPKNLTSVLVVGLGNKKITADSLGPSTSSFVLATRHISDSLKSDIGLPSLFPVSCVNTGVLGDTGIETCEIIKGIVEQTKPSCVIAVDALAASSAERLGTTIQFSDSGISPGSGVGNHRNALTKESLGVPVIAIGIPTVVDSATIVMDAMEKLLEGEENVDAVKYMSRQQPPFPELNNMYMTGKDIDAVIKRISFTVSEGINIAMEMRMS